MRLADIPGMISNGIVSATGAISGWIFGQTVVPPIAAILARNAAISALGPASSWGGRIAITLASEHAANFAYTCASTYAPAVCATIGTATALGAVQLGYITYRGVVYVVHTIQDNQYQATFSSGIADMNDADASAGSGHSRYYLTAEDLAALNLDPILASGSPDGRFHLDADDLEELEELNAKNPNGFEIIPRIEPTQIILTVATPEEVLVAQETPENNINLDEIISDKRPENGADVAAAPSSTEVIPTRADETDPIVTPEEMIAIMVAVVQLEDNRVVDTKDLQHNPASSTPDSQNLEPPFVREEAPRALKQ